MKSTNYLVLSALLVALVCVGTMVIQIPITATQGYINVGDAVIFSIAIIFGRKIGLLAGGLGSALADLLSGYAVWAPWTLVIKGVEGYIAGSLGDDRGVLTRRTETPLPIRTAGASAPAALFMVSGYLIAAAVMYGWPAAFADLIPNGLQGIGSVLLAVVLVPVLRRITLSLRVKGTERRSVN